MARCVSLAHHFIALAVCTRAGLLLDKPQRVAAYGLSPFALSRSIFANDTKRCARALALRASFA